MPYFKIHFTADCQGEIIYEGENEAEVRREFESDAQDVAIWERGIQDCLEVGDFEIVEIEPVKEKLND